jgi:hypothetical protein
MTNELRNFRRLSECLTDNKYSAETKHISFPFCCNLWNASSSILLKAFLYHYRFLVVGAKRELYKLETGDRKRLNIQFLECLQRSPTGLSKKKIFRFLENMNVVLHSISKRM